MLLPLPLPSPLSFVPAEDGTTDPLERLSGAPSDSQFFFGAVVFGCYQHDASRELLRKLLTEGGDA